MVLFLLSADFYCFNNEVCAYVTACVCELAFSAPLPETYVTEEEGKLWLMCQVSLKEMTDEYKLVNLIFTLLFVIPFKYIVNQYS